MLVTLFLDAAAMLVFLAILLLPLSIGKSGTTRPLVTLTPNWGNILAGDPATLTCNVPSTALAKSRTYKWYKDQRPIAGAHQTLQITSSSVENGGDYQCQADAGDISHSVTLHVLESYVILQRPPSIFEGDDLTLRCHHADGLNALSTKYFKDDIEIQPFYSNTKQYTKPNENSELYIHKVDLNTTGTYRCNKSVKHVFHNSTFVLSDGFKAIVKELFSPPEIKVTPYRVIEGGDMTVTCDTRLDPLRANTELRFAFYKDGRPVQEFDASDSYRVRSAQLEDSGNYTCDVMTASDAVRKASVGFYVQISQLQDYTLQNIIRLVLSGLVLAAALCFVYIHIKW